jgi:ParB/RepB/Spo0J family partition protein
MLPLASVTPDADQHRKSFPPEWIRELADSIAAQGLNNPVTVRETGPGAWAIVDGECRYRAFKLLGRDTIPAFVRTGTPLEILTLQGSANMNRLQPTPCEEGGFYRAWVNLWREGNEGMTEREGVDACAKEFGKTTRRIGEGLRLDGLQPEVRALVDAPGQEGLTREAGLALARLTEGEHTREQELHQVRMAKHSVVHGHSPDKVAALVAHYLNGLAQGAMFGDEDLGGAEKLAARQGTRKMLDKVLDSVVKVIAKVWSDRTQAFRPELMGMNELVSKVAALKGAIKTLGQIVALCEEGMAMLEVAEACKRKNGAAPSRSPLQEARL